MEEQDIFSVVGVAGFERLVAAFYRQVPPDDILGPMYRGRDLAGAEKRMREFLIFRFGGPAWYIENRGHPRLRMRHFPFSIDGRARDRWVQLMERALLEAQFPPDAEAALRTFFHSTATFLINRPDAAEA